MDKWADIDEDQKTNEIRDACLTYLSPQMSHAFHPGIDKVPPGYDGTTSWFEYPDAAEKRCDRTKVETKRRGPAITVRLLNFSMKGLTKIQRFLCKCGISSDNKTVLCKGQ